jgi:hypothetical protein
VVKVTVWPKLLPGSITANPATVNFGESPGATITGTLPQGGGCEYPQYTYYWQKSADGVSFVDIGDSWGVNRVSYVTGPLTVRTWYRRVVWCATEKVYSNSVLINVYPPLDPGNITPGYYDVTYNSSPGAIAANPASGGCGSGYVYEWQQSTDGEATYQSICSGAVLTCPVGNITTTTFVRRKVTCGTGVAYTRACKIVPGGSGGMNYIRTRIITKPGQTDLAAANALTALRDVKQTTEYFDGLGRLAQTVVKQGAYPTAGAATDLVTMSMYDEFGRPAASFLPFASATGDGDEKFNPLLEAYNFGNTQYSGQNENMYYGQVQYEPSPLNRSLKNMMAGNSWIGNNRGVEVKQVINTEADKVRMWDVVGGNTGSFGSYNILDFYPAGTLFKKITTDEHGKQVITFTDKSGNVILKKIQLKATADDGAGRDYDGWLCTYYLYDEVGNLQCVIQPRGVELLLENNWNINALNGNILNEQCFRYAYDERNRMVIKKVPGAGEVYLLYDKRDRLVFTQDANLRNQHQWQATLYDAINRPVITGLLTWNDTRSDFQQLVNMGGGNSSLPIDLVLPESSHNGAYSGDYMAKRSVTLDVGFETADNASFSAAVMGGGSGDWVTVVDGQTIINNSLPEGAPFTILTTTYYDNYNGIAANGAQYGSKDNSFDSYFAAASNNNWPYAESPVASNATMGMVTGTKTRILNVPGDQFQYTANFYDDNGRGIQTKSSNISGGKEITTTHYSFS